MAQILQPIVITAATTLNRKTHAMALCVLNSATGRILTLPASVGKGDVYTIFVRTTVSSGNHVIAVANATDVMQGGLALSTDIGGTNMLTGATADTITLNGSTQGGLSGSWIELTDAVAGFWQVKGFLVTTGTETDPFSAAVS